MTDRHHVDQTASITPGSDPAQLAKVHQARAREDHPKQIGLYKVLEVLGEGGMGTVYLAEQEKPIHRRVALKIIKLGMDTKSVIARFEAEREALAVMDHPNVAKVFDAGATEQGRPYFVMEYVKGIPITDYCDRHRLSTEERLRLFMDVCHAVQHAHQKGIIHRDIKPSNVLVTVQDDKPIVKVIDFGVAKATQHRLTEQTVFTEHGQLIGTPGYMSPEQAEMTALDIDTRTDIYSLGVLLYELLVGMRPFDDDLLQRAAIGEIQRIIRESDPPKPSTRLSGLLSEPPPSFSADSPDSAEQRTSARVRARGSLAEIARARHTEPKTLARQIRGDLDWIVMKCLEKDRTRRYDTANALAMELQRYLKNEPVLAGPPSASYRLEKFVRRHRVKLAAAGMVVAALVLGAIGIAWQAVRVTRERDRAIQAELVAQSARNSEKQQRQEAEMSRDRATAIMGFLEDMIRSVDPSEARGREIAVREVLDRKAESVGNQFFGQPEVESDIRRILGRTYFHLGVFEQAQVHLRKSLELRLAAPDADPLALANAYTDLGAVQQQRGQFEEAERLYGSALKVLQERLPDEHSRISSIQYNLGTLAFHRGDYGQAEELWKRVLETRKVYLGRNHPDVGVVLSALAETAKQGGDLERAEALQREVLVMRRDSLGDDHPLVAEILLNIGALQLDRGELLQASVSLNDAYERYQRLYKGEHTGMAMAMNYLAKLHFLEGDFGEAERLVSGAIALQRRLVGHDHPLLGDYLRHAGLILMRAGKSSEAEKALREGLSIVRRDSPESHVQVANTESLLGECLMMQEQYSEAEPLLVKSYQALRERRGDSHRDTASAAGRLAALYERRGRSDEAVMLRDRHTALENRQD
jgi:eukaryotic-like serine/threonine-protein kinase